MYQIIEIAEDGRYLSKYRGFLRINNKHDTLADVVIEDIQSLIISANDTVLSKQLMVELAIANIPVIFCGKNYLPEAMSLPVYQHYLSHHRLEQQIAASKRLKGHCWKTLIKEKIQNQAQLLTFFQCEGVERLNRLSKQVKIADTENTEAQAALVYWKALMGSRFRRDRALEDHNVLLNYGYAVLRAATARALCASGLNLSLGVHHKNKLNAMCLVDDFMEPFRPIIDLEVKMILNASDGEAELTTQAKQAIIRVLQQDLLLDGQKSPLVQCLLKLAQSYVSSLEKNINQLNIAIWRPAD